MSKVFIRNKAVDLIKMIALFTMVIDHLKFVFPSYQSQLVIVGRWAFVFFCFVVAFNASEALAKNKINTIKSYFLNLALWRGCLRIRRRLWGSVYTYRFYLHRLYFWLIPRAFLCARRPVRRR